MARNRPRIKPRILELMTRDSCIREKFVGGLWTRLASLLYYPLTFTTTQGDSHIKDDCHLLIQVDIKLLTTYRVE